MGRQCKLCKVVNRRVYHVTETMGYSGYLLRHDGMCQFTPGEWIFQKKRQRRIVKIEKNNTDFLCLYQYPFGTSQTAIEVGINTFFGGIWQHYRPLRPQTIQVSNPKYFARRVELNSIERHTKATRSPRP